MANLFQLNSMCNRLWPYKTTVQLQMFYSLVLQLWNFSTPNDLQFTAVILKWDLIYFIWLDLILFLLIQHKNIFQF